MYQSIYYDKFNSRYFIRDDKLGIVEGVYEPYAYTRAKDGECKTIYGDRVTRIPNDDGRNDGLFESDINPEMRILIDTYYESDDVSENRVVTLDIEVSFEDSFPLPQEAKHEITAIALHDSVTGEYHVYLLDKDGSVQSGLAGTTHLHSCVDERSLLGRFIDKMSEINPTIITGWNIDGFDITYLVNRIDKVLNKAQRNRLSPFGNIYWNKYRQRYVIDGVSCLDYMSLYKKHTFTNQASYSLENISQLELGRGKIDYSDRYSNLEELRKGDLELFIQYNVTDVELVVALEQKLKFIDLTIGVCHIAHVPYEDIYMDSRVIDGAILTYLKRNGLVAPNRPPRGSRLGKAEEKKFTGAYVKPPIAGRYNNVYDLDLTSLYPSILISLNISPETKMFRIDDWDEEKFLNDSGDFTVNGKTLSVDKLKAFLSQNNACISSNGVVYSRKTVGIVPTILNDWFDKRVKYVSLMQKYGNDGDDEKYKFYKQRQLIQKVLLNSVYGVFGLSTFRYHDIDNALSVTLSGQTVIKRTVQVANSFYNREVGEVYEAIIRGEKRVYYKNEHVMMADGTSKMGCDLVSGDETVDGIIDFIRKVHKHEFNTSKVFDVRDEKHYDAYFSRLHENLYDFNLYIDTDSVFMSADPIIRVRNKDWRTKSQDDIIGMVYDVAGEVQNLINESYDVLARKFFFLDTHRFKIKQEMVAKTALWTGKKQYAQHIVSEKGVAKDEIDVKGIAVVRSSFPKKFKYHLKEILEMMLKNASKEDIDEKVLSFEHELVSIDVFSIPLLMDISRASTMNGINDYAVSYDKDNLHNFVKGTPYHVKASMTYNRMLNHLGCSMKYAPINDGDKAKMVYLQSNPYGIDAIAFKADGNDPEEILDFIQSYADARRMLSAEVKNKIQRLYDALGWTIPSAETAHMSKFFAF